MIQIIQLPPKADWNKLLARPEPGNDQLLEKVRAILNDVKYNGDEAVKLYSKAFDGIELQSLQPGEAEWAAANEIPQQLKDAIRLAAANITRFHQQATAPAAVIETMPGVQCWKRTLPIQKVGLYIPGGSAPLFSSLLMTGIPAKLAGCPDIIVCSPPGKNGNLHPALLYTAAIIGIRNIYKVGGAQAIAAMAYGTASIPAVYKIAGPGNRYVTAAKQLVQQQGLAIDLPAGPSEVCILADETANPSFLAADLLAQAEHGPDSQVILVTTCPEQINAVIAEISKQVELLPRKTIALEALQHGKLIAMETLAAAMELVNAYAPEHLIISCRNADVWAAQVVNAGSVFIGELSPESAGDYASGTNHTLPTNGYAKSYSGIGVDSFVKTISYQQLNRQGFNNISAAVISMAEAEGLQAHANAIRIRINKTN